MEDIGSVPIRKRGRPAGKCRKPLNQEQRKARNAQYERERRGEISEATSQLIEAIGLDSSVSVANLLNSALELIESKSKTPSQSIQALRKRNDDLCKEIQDLENFLSRQQTKKNKESSSSSKINKRGIKRKAENESPSNIIEQRENKTVVEQSEYKFELKSDDFGDSWIDSI